METQELVPLITDTAWNLLREMDQDDAGLDWDGNVEDPTFSWGCLPDGQGQRIQPERAHGILRNAVDHHLKTYGKVLLYHCGDNATIGLEGKDIHNNINDQNWEDYYHADYPNIPHLYIGWD